MKKAAALLIVLLIITALGTVALTVARSVISGVGFTSALSDAMVAEQASQAGLEYGLLLYKNGTTSWSGTRNLGSGISATVTISQDATGLITIKSIGSFGLVKKQHILRQKP
jgi:Tfp pilus assembly protein PilX